MNETKSPALFVATPMYGGMCIGNYASALMQLPIICSRSGVRMYYTYMMNESLITRARNSLAHDFLASDATHLMFIDADIGFNPNDIVEMVKRDVFEKLDAHPATKPFNNDIGLPVELNPYMKTYFDTAVRENRYYSEDWTFCENWRDIGGQVWVDKRVLLRHVGTYTFDYATHEQLYKDLKQMFEPGTVNVTPVSQTEALPNNAVPAGHELAKEPVPEPEPTVMASSKKSKKAAAAA